MAAAGQHNKMALNAFPATKESPLQALTPLRNERSFNAHLVVDPLAVIEASVVVFVVSVAVSLAVDPSSLRPSTQFYMSPTNRGFQASPTALVRQGDACEVGRDEGGKGTS